MARRVLAGLTHPALLGAALMLALAAQAGAGPVVDPSERVLGQDASGLANLVSVRFADEIRAITREIAALALVYGAALGLAADALLALRDRLAARPRGPLRRRVEALAVAAGLQAWLFFATMARLPAPFSKVWYEAELPFPEALGPRVMMFVTDRLGTRGVHLVGVTALALLLLGLPLRWPRALRRALTLARAHRARWRRRAALAFALAALAIAARPLADRASAALHPAPSRPSVLVLAADSLRADRLAPRTMPRLSALADRGTRFDRAYVTVARTFPSWSTILTGRFPHHHGMRWMFARWEDRQRPLDALPARLARAGYATRVISDFAGDSFPLGDFGFDRVDAPRLHFRNLIRSRAFARETVLFPFLASGVGRRLFPAMSMQGDSADPEILADAAVETLRELRGRPFFLTVFFSSPHFPYAAPEPHYRTFTAGGYRGRFKYRKDAGFTSLDPESVGQVRGLYDGAIASVDAASGRILDALRRLGLAESTIVVVTGDHGEALFESGRWHGHGDNLFGDEASHVPLAIVDPRRGPGGARPEIVRDVDLAPTLYALTGVAAPPDLDGRSLAPALAGAPLAPAYAYGETELWLGDSPVVPPELRLPYPGLLGLLEIDDRHGDEVVLKPPYPRVTITARHRSIRDDRFKLVYMPTPSGPRYRLFDTAADPGETRDATAEHPAERARLEAALWRWMLEDPTVAARDGMLVDR